jgi:hypothetical protein
MGKAHPCALGTCRALTCLLRQPWIIVEQEEQAERVGPNRIITLGTGVPEHEAVRLSCQPWGDELPRQGHVLEKTNSTNEKEKSG